MNLKLSKPICFFDLETTGVNVGSDRIVEIAILKIMPDGTRLIKSKRINPGISIPANVFVYDSLQNSTIQEDLKIF